MATHGADEGPSQTGETSGDAPPTHTESDHSPSSDVELFPSNTTYVGTAPVDGTAPADGTAVDGTAVDGGDGHKDAEPLPEWATAEPDPYEGPGIYASYDVVTPQTYRTGRYQVSRMPPPTQPPDPILPFIAPPVARRRRSDWPVLVVALVVAAILLAVCCIAGYALYLSNGLPFS